MATIVGRFGMSHGPQLYVPPELWPNILRRDDMGAEKPGMREQTSEAMMQRRYDACLKAMDTVRTRIDETAPDTIVLIGDDQRENLLADNTPPFLVYIGDEADASTRVSHYHLGDEFTDTITRYRVDVPLARWTIDSLLDAGVRPRMVDRHAARAGTRSRVRPPASHDERRRPLPDRSGDGEHVLPAHQFAPAVRGLRARPRQGHRVVRRVPARRGRRVRGALPT